MSGAVPIAGAGDRDRGVLVAGAGQAGLQVAVTLREHGYLGPITLVGSETHPPYQRPPLSKAFLKGDVDVDSVLLRTEEFFAEHEIVLRTGETVTTAVAPTPGRGGSAVTSLGGEVAFDHLVIATGAVSRRLDVPGVELDGVRSLRSIEDARDLRTVLREPGRVVVIGGGFIGLEAAAVAGQLGHDVVVVEVADRLVGRAVTPAVSAHLQRMHEARGVVVRLGLGVTQVHGREGRVVAVQLSDGSMLDADLVVVGIGAIPVVALAHDVGALCRGGVVVDTACRTSVPGVLAVGDCTVGGHARAGEGARLESVQNATEQARVAAMTILGSEARYDVVPFFWSDQGETKMQIIGWALDADELVVRGVVGQEPFSVLAFRAGRLVAAECVGAPHDFMAARRALTSGRSVDRVEAAQASRPLKECIVG